MNIRCEFLPLSPHFLKSAHTNSVLHSSHQFYDSLRVLDGAITVIGIMRSIGHPGKYHCGSILAYRDDILQKNQTSAIDCQICPYIVPRISFAVKVERSAGFLDHSH
jgi:hypothetical protein